jgi:hypothetical protein
MVLRIERVSLGQVVALRLSGRLQSEHVEQLKAQIDASSQKVILDLDEVRLVDRDVVRFLEICETNGIELSHCPRYIREWIDREKASRADC